MTSAPTSSSHPSPSASRNSTRGRRRVRRRVQRAVRERRRRLAHDDARRRLGLPRIDGVPRDASSRRSRLRLPGGRRRATSRRDEGLHVAADEAFHPDEIRAAFATITSALAIPTSRETRSARAFLDETFRLPRDDPADGGEKGLTPPRARRAAADDAGRGVRARAPGPRRRRRRRVRRATTRARASRRPRGRLRRRRGTFRDGARGRASGERRGRDGRRRTHAPARRHPSGRPGRRPRVTPRGGVTRVKSLAGSTPVSSGFDAAHLAARLGDPGILAAVPRARRTCARRAGRRVRRRRTSRRDTDTPTPSARYSPSGRIPTGSTAPVERRRRRRRNGDAPPSSRRWRGGAGTRAEAGTVGTGDVGTGDGETRVGTGV